MKKYTQKEVNEIGRKHKDHFTELKLITLQNIEPKYNEIMRAMTKAIKTGKEVNIGIFMDHEIFITAKLEKKY